MGHVIRTTVVVDEFECQLKCMGNNSCKSINVHPGEGNEKRSCELNNKTRQMKPGHFKKKKGSTYYSSVQVGFGLSRFVDNFSILFTAKNNVSELLLYNNGNWENHSLLAYIGLLKVSGKRFSKRVLTISITVQFPFCNNLRTKRFHFCLYRVFWVLTRV